VELGAERRVRGIEGLEPRQVGRRGDDFHALGHGVIVVVHQLEQVQVVVLEELQVHLGGALGGGVLVAEVVPHAEGRAIHRLARQRGPHPLDLVHGRSLQSSRYALRIMGWLTRFRAVSCSTIRPVWST